MPEQTTAKSERKPDSQDQCVAPPTNGVGSLESRLEACERQRDEYLNLLKRTQADFANYQKRLQRDLAEERRYAHADLARELLLVLDNLERALESSRQVPEQGPLMQGVAMVHQQLLDILCRFGITRVEALHQPFDPMVHEAVAQQPIVDLVPGTVTQVLEPGYRLHERVLRPARVVVAAAPTGG